MLIAAYLILLAAGSTRGVGFGSPDGYIYDVQGTENAEVFNLKQNWFSIQGRRTAKVSRSSEMAGHFKPCSTKVLHCISGGPLNLIVPKIMVAGSWVHGKTECVTVVVSLNRISGRCISPTVETNYNFDAQRGLISYRRGIPHGNGGYRNDSVSLIRGQRGLFSPNP